MASCPSGGSMCCFPNCNSRNTIHRDRHFHTIPRDEERRAIWLERINRPDLLLKSKEQLCRSYRVCSLHFDSNMYMSSTSNKLVWNAVPTSSHNGIRGHIAVFRPSSGRVTSLQGTARKNPKLIESEHPEKKTVSDDTSCPRIPHETKRSCEKSSECIISVFEPDELKKDQRTHSKKPYKCTLCNSSFFKSHHLKAHMRTHTGDKPYKCTVCDSLFSHSGSLKRHTRIHTGDKPFKCTLCESSFTGSGYLTKHMRIHTGEKLYHCMICETTFSHLGSLKNHVKTHMNGYFSNEKSRGCNIEIPFGSSHALPRHAKPFSIMSCVKEEVSEEGLESLVNISGSSYELMMSQVKEEIKVEEHDIDEVTV